MPYLPFIRRVGPVGGRAGTDGGKKRGRTPYRHDKPPTDRYRCPPPRTRDATASGKPHFHLHSGFRLSNLHVEHFADNATTKVGTQWPTLPFVTLQLQGKPALVPSKPSTCGTRTERYTGQGTPLPGRPGPYPYANREMPQDRLAYQASPLPHITVIADSKEHSQQN